MQSNPAPLYTNISELRKSPTRVIKEAQGEIVAVFNHGDIISYLVSPEMLQELLAFKQGQASMKSSVEVID